MPVASANRFIAITALPVSFLVTVTSVEALFPTRDSAIMLECNFRVHPMILGRSAEVDWDLSEESCFF